MLPRIQRAGVWVSFVAWGFAGWAQAAEPVGSRVSAVSVPSGYRLVYEQHFDDTGKVDNIRVWATAEPESKKAPFSAKAGERR